MRIDEEKCIGCEACHPYCPVEAISTMDGKSISAIDLEKCVECGVCFRAQVCPTDAIYQQELSGPRSVRAAFSNPFAIHPVTNMRGRGTEEMKTNDVTGRFRRGFAGVAIEMGRPVLGTHFRDLQTVAMEVAKLGVTFEPENPVTAMMADRKTGKIDEAYLNEKALTAIIEFMVKEEKLEEILQVIREISNKIETVFSMSVISRVDTGGKIPISRIVEKAGYSVRLNMKTNLGLGKPFKAEV
jgi:Fe-S-cluster-containing hydrogenase component 2